MGPRLGDALSGQDHDPVRVPNGGEAVRHHQRGAARAEGVESGLDLRLGDVVQRTRRLVEDQQPGVLQEDPGDGDALPLPAGERHAALAHVGVVAVRQRLHEGVERCAPCGRLHFRVRRVHVAVGDVVADGAAEEVGVLLHDADVPPQRRPREAADVGPVQRDASFVGLVEAGEQVTERRLAAARRADQRHGLAGGDRERQVRQDLLSAVVAEADVLEGDGALQVGQLDGARSVLLRLRRQKLLNAYEARDARLKLFREVDELPDRLREEPHKDEVCGEVPRVDRAPVGEEAARRQGREGEDVHKKAGPREELRHGAVLLAAGRLVGAVADPKLARLVRGAPERLGDAHARHGVLQVRVHLADLHARAHGRAPQLAPLAGREPDQQGDEREDDEGQRHVQGAEQEEGARQHHQGDEEVLGAVVGQLRDLEGVVDDAGHQGSRSGSVEEGEGQALEVVERLAPDVHLDAHAHDVSVVLDEVVQARAERVEPQQHGHPRQDRPERPPGKPGVDDGAGDHGVEEPAQGEREGAGHVRQEEPHMGDVVARELFEHGAVSFLTICACLL